MSIDGQFLGMASGGREGIGFRAEAGTMPMQAKAMTGKERDVAAMRARFEQADGPPAPTSSKRKKENESSRGTQGSSSSRGGLGSGAAGLGFEPGLGFSGADDDDEPRGGLGSAGLGSASGSSTGKTEGIKFVKGSADARDNGIQQPPMKKMMFTKASSKE